MRRMGVKLLLSFLIAGWVSVAVASVLVLPSSISGASPRSPDADNGKKLFEKRCTGCHELDKNKEGPRLRGIYGRRAGSAAGFSYSGPLKAANLTWDEVSLDKWLANPDAVAPDNDMAFQVSNPQERADIIQFLRLSSGK